MCGLRQSLWRLPEEEVGDPSATDRLPEAGTTKLTWTSTDKMLADPLTKGMKHDGLKRLMDGFEVDMSPTLDGLRAKKEYGCEMEHVDLAESSLHAVDAAVADATGIDISPEMLSKAMRSGFYSCCKVVDLKKRFEGLEDEAFDLTLCLGTLTYMSPEDMTLTELCRVTKKGGYVVFSMRTDLCEKWEAAQAALEQKGVWTHLGTSEGFDYLPANPEYGNTILVKVYVYQVA
ncbi:unnamed protein product [Durusdinium trenchii]|uniref:Methyltransferase type 11 domain-containing protein n=1 Tax=Durusdinium trenchii TaxID=1381693 RepID=A0ABP0PKS8_9DINO